MTLNHTKANPLYFNQEYAKSGIPNLVLYLNDLLTTPYGATVFCALLHQKLPFSIELIDLNAQENLKTEYLKQSKTAKVPMLVVDHSFYLSESSAICEYLNDRFAASHGAIYPKNIEQLAICRQIQALIRSDFLAIRHERAMNLTFSKADKPTLSTQGKQQTQKLVFFAEQFINSKNPDYVIGEWSIADVDLAIILSRLAFSQDANDLLPAHLITYTQKHWQNGYLKAFLDLRQAHGFDIFAI
jgi:glutathione S-transferase